MGTRSLTMVIDQKGTKKVAQYGQWDGYPSGVGSGVLDFLKDKELFKKFKSKLSNVRFLDEKGKDKAFIESYNENAPKWSNEPDNRTEEQKRWFDTYCTRNLAHKVLINIANAGKDAEIILIDSEDTAKGDGWVEYSYVINLKKNTLSVHGHVDCKPMKVYKLNNLPKKSEFIKELEKIENEQ